MNFRSRGPRMGFLLVAVALPSSFSPIASAAVKRNPWAVVPGPTPGVSESIGHYSAGCLRGGQRLPANGVGYQAVRLKRNRHYGHPALIDFVEELGREVAKNGEPGLLVGDMGLPRGGPTKSAHQSHQTGLDSDLWYSRTNRPFSSRERERTSAKRMVHPRKLAVLPDAFGATEISLLKRVAEKPSVDRVLVNFAIKKELCEKFPESDWIRKIRPWYGHDYHFHVRLQCPATDSQCQRLPEIAAGNGCDESLDWWWSDEARFPGRKKKTANPVAAAEKPKRLAIPDACDAVLAGR